MNEINVSWQTLEQISDRMRQYAERLDSDMLNMVNRQRAMAAYWQGDAYNDFSRKLNAIATVIGEQTNRLRKLSARTAEKAHIIQQNPISD